MGKWLRRPIVGLVDEMGISSEIEAFVVPKAGPGFLPRRLRWTAAVAHVAGRYQREDVEAELRARLARPPSTLDDLACSHILTAVSYTHLRAHET